MMLGLLSTTAISSMRPPMLAGPIDRQTKGFKIGSSVWLIGAGSAGTGGGACATMPLPVSAHNPTPPNATRRRHRIPRFTGDVSLNASTAGDQRPKLTFGACLASAGTSKYGYSLKPNIFAVTFEGNFRRWVLYSWTRSL